ncbi:MAG: cholesterol oxidase, partial [Deltaproteobacteria bacterium]|nr:cholesterol oxidase [Deltaproteobacteria bacterium]
YLYLAEEKYGVEILPETEVIGVRPTESGYELFTKRSTGLRHPRKTVFARGVVFSGGVLGTIKLLFECKTKGLLPNISKKLGHSVRTNSEALLTVTAKDRKANFSDHIAITSGIYPDQKTHIEVVRYNKGSDVMGNLVTILTGGGGRIPRFIRFIGNILRHPWAFLKSFWIFGWGARTPILLVMQTAENNFQFNYKRRWWRLGKKTMNSEISPDSQKIPSYIPIANQVARRMGEKINGQPMSAWTEALFDISSTAHILGGCAMSESAEDGVVDFTGQLHGYPNIYVVDGSNVPANLGVNPALTITAIAEYIMSQIPEKSERS